MKFLIEAVMPTETGNRKVKDGSLLKFMQQYMGEIRPEAVYYSIAHGKRTCYMIVDIASADKLPEIAEPLWLNAQAEVNFIPVMDQDDFQKAIPAIQKAAKSMI